MKKYLPSAAIIALLATAALFYFLFPQTNDMTTTTPKPGELIYEGTQTLIGTLSLDKYRKGGSTLTTEKAIIFIDDNFFDTPTGQEALKLDGRQVDVRGDVTTRYCGGDVYIQCLEQGFISNVDKIQYIKLAK